MKKTIIFSAVVFAWTATQSLACTASSGGLPWSDVVPAVAEMERYLTVEGITGEGLAGEFNKPGGWGDRLRRRGDIEGTTALAPSNLDIYWKNISPRGGTCTRYRLTVEAQVTVGMDIAPNVRCLYRTSVDYKMYPDGSVEVAMVKVVMDDPFGENDGEFVFCRRKS